MEVSRFCFVLFSSDMLLFLYCILFTPFSVIQMTPILDLLTSTHRTLRFCSFFKKPTFLCFSKCLIFHDLSWTYLPFYSGTLFSCLDHLVNCLYWLLHYPIIKFPVDSSLYSLFAKIFSLSIHYTSVWICLLKDVMIAVLMSLSDKYNNSIILVLVSVDCFSFKCYDKKFLILPMPGNAG